MISPQIQHQDLHVTWEEYNQTGTRLASIIQESGWKFDQILCIARGGMFIGDMLSRIFNKPLAIISASSYRGQDGKEQRELYISVKIAMIADKLAKNVLIVDDLVDSGNTFAKIVELIQKENPGIEIRTGVLWEKNCSKFNPDFVAKAVDEDVWIHQPFEIFDNVSLESLKMNTLT